MKSKLLLCSIILASIAMMSNRSGRAATTGNGATTAPGEFSSTCSSFGCHFSGAFSPVGEIQLLTPDSQRVEKYVPGQDYIVSINIEHTGFPAGYGFQIVGLRSSDNSAVNGFKDLPNRVQQLMIGSRQYVEHGDILQTNPILLNWTAPEFGTGEVDFYAAVNVVNGNGDSSGDGADTTRLKVFEDPISQSNFSQFDDFEISIYPNPSSDYINIQSEKNITSAQILDITGKNLLTSNNVQRIDVSQLQNGIYILQLRTEDQSIVLKKLMIN